MQPKGNLDYRLSGLFLSLLGGGATYWGLLRPGTQALNGVEHIDYSNKIGLIGPIALLFGLYMLAFGAEAAPVLNGKVGKPVLAFLIIGFVIYIFACLIGMDYFFKSMGYG